MEKKRLLSLSTAGALMLSMFQGISLNANATLLPLKSYKAELVLNAVSEKDLEHVKVSDLQKMLVVKDYAKVTGDEAWNGYSDGDVDYKDCSVSDIAGMPANISLARYDDENDTYEVFTSTDEIDLSEYASTSKMGSRLTLMAGTGKQIDDDHNVWLDLTIYRNISQVPLKNISIDLSAYTYDELRNYPVDNLKKDLKSDDKDFDISKATTLWTGEDTSYTFGKGQTFNIKEIALRYDDEEDDEYDSSYSYFVIGSGRYAIDTAENECTNTNYRLSSKLLDKLSYTSSLLTKGEDGKLSVAVDDASYSSSANSYYEKEKAESDADGNVSDYDAYDWEYDEETDDEYLVYYKYKNYIDYDVNYARYFGNAIKGENYFKLSVDKEKLDKLKESGISLDVYKYNDLKALAGDKTIFKVAAIPSSTKSVTDSILTYTVYDEESDSYKTLDVDGVKVDLSTRSTDNVFAVVYSRPSADGKSSVVLSYDFVVVSGSISMLTDGDIDILSTDDKYENETEYEYFSTNNDKFDAESGEFSDIGSNDLNYEGDLDRSKNSAIDNEHYLVFNSFVFEGHNPNSKNSLFEFTRYAYDKTTKENNVSEAPVSLEPGDSCWVNLYDDYFKSKAFDANDYKIVFTGTVTKGIDEDFDTEYLTTFKLYQGNIEAAGYSLETDEELIDEYEKTKDPELLQQFSYDYNELYDKTYNSLKKGDKVTFEVGLEDYKIKLDKDNGFGFNIWTELYMSIDSVQLVKIDKGTYKVRPSKVYEGTYATAAEITEAKDIKDVTDAILANGDNKGYKLEGVKKNADSYYEPIDADAKMSGNYTGDSKDFTLVFEDGTIKNINVYYWGYYSADPDKTPPVITLSGFDTDDYYYYDDTPNDSDVYKNSYTYYEGEEITLEFCVFDKVGVDHGTLTINDKSYNDKFITADNYDAEYECYYPRITIEDLKEGKYTIVAKAYDKANNEMILNAELTVEKKPESTQPVEDPTDEPQVFNDIPIRTGIDPFFTATGVLYKNSDGEYVEADCDHYILSNAGVTVDSLGAIGYQTVLVKENLTDAQMSQLKLVYKSADKVKNWQDGTLTKLKIFRENVPQKSGETVNDFSKGSVHFTAITDNEDKTAHEDKSRNYQVSVVTQNKGGAKLYVNGPDEREVMFNELYGYYHDVSVINTGDANLTGLKAELINAKNVKLDKYWVVGGENNTTLKPVFTNNDSYVAKIRLLPDGDGEISGKLKITADGQPDKIIELKGRAGNPKITVKEIDPAVKFVPYSNLIATSNMYDWVKVSFRLKPEYVEEKDEDGNVVVVEKPTKQKLPEGITLNPENGELYGTPQVAGEYEFSVEAVFTVDPYYEDYVQFSNSSVDLKLVVKPNENEIVYSASDEGYPVKQSIGTDQGDHDFVLDYELEEGVDEDTDYPLSNVEDLEDLMFASNGEYSTYKKFWFNGEELKDGTDYTSKSGSTEITIKSQTLKNKVRAGENTIAIEFRNDKGELKRTAQNFRVSVKNKAHTHSWGDWVVTTKPTTEKEGVETRTCKTCGKTETRVIPVHVHEWGDWKVTKEPTEDEDGERVRTCKDCGEKEKEKLDKLNDEGDGDASDVIKEQTDKNKGKDGDKTIDITPVPKNTIAVDMLVYLIDADNNPVGDKLVEIHSDVYSARTSSSGYAKYLGVESGKHRISVIDDAGAVEAEKSFEIIKGDKLALNGSTITALDGSEVMMTVKLDGDSLELVSVGAPKTMNNDELDITDENVTGDPEKTKNSKTNNDAQSNNSDNGNGSNAVDDANGGSNNPTTGNPAASFGAGIILIAASLLLSKKKRR